MLLNSSAVTGAIAGASQVGGLAVIADQVGEVANNLIARVTESPVNMSITGVTVAAVLYLLFK
jgi:hypothetical protein